MTTEWNGQGLPPAAQARMDRGRAGGPSASLFGISGQAALEACGFDVVGEVMGCIVQHIGFQGWGGCGYAMRGPGLGGTFGAAFPNRGGAFGAGAAGGGGGGPFGGGGGQYGNAANPYRYQPGVRTSSGGGLTGFAPYVDALYYGYDTALLRMLLECRDLRGDGVVGVRVEQRNLGEGNREFLTFGTAVRAQTKVRPTNLFSTPLPAHDVAKLLHRGWVPASTTIGISLAVRHDDYVTRQQASSLWSGNTEVSGYTELVHQVRQDARAQFARRSRAFGAEGAIMSDMTLNIWEMECGENMRDHVALSYVLGTSIAKFRVAPDVPTKSLKILSLSDPAGKKP